MDILETQVRTFYEQIWNRRQLDQVEVLLQEDFVFRGSLGQHKQGHAGFIEYVNFIHGALSGYHCEIDDIVVQAPKVFARMLFSGRHDAQFMGHPASGKQLSWQGAALFQFRDDKIASLWVLGDLKQLELQLEQ